jgi:hypothetical protein
MRVVPIFAFTAAVLILAGCATDRYRWSLAHAYMSPRARQLPRPELEEIVWLVSHAWSDTIIAVGASCSEGPDQMRAVAKYTEYEVMVFDLKKISGHWRIIDSGEGTPTISSAWYGC